MTVLRTASALLLEYELYFSAPAMTVLRHPTPTSASTISVPHQSDPLQIVLSTRKVYDHAI